MDSYSLVGYIARRKDFEIPIIHYGIPAFIRRAITLEHPRGLILVRNSPPADIFFRTQGDGEVMKGINAPEINYFDVNDWRERLYVRERV